MTTSDDDKYGATHWQTVRRLFHEALELPSSERVTFLDSECQGNDDLRRAVESMLDADSKAENFLEPPVRLLHKELEIGQWVGPYRINARLGAGNMGEVYRAERETSFRMAVALKVIDATKVDDEMVWRFKHERQILALLDHPNIARIIDGGALDDGRPWFALEYVEGERIDQYCNRLKLTLRERVKLFRKACAAVSEAHSLAVVHRDLKPANILVTSDGEPKLLDFGIAKMIDGEPVATDVRSRHSQDSLISTSESELGTSPLTPLYSSPEQAARILDPDAKEHSPIGVRSDVYTLGVVLYELLTGHPAYRVTNSWQEVLRAVVEEIPRPLSEAVTTERRRETQPVKVLEPASVAAERSVKPRRLRQQLVGDLDAIVQRALEKQPEDRYPSVDRLDADLQAYLTGHPVEARRSERLYRAWRFLRRNLLPAVVGTAAFLIVSIYLAMDWRGKNQVFETRKLLFELTQIQIEDLSDDAFARELRQTVADYGNRLWLADMLEELGLDLEERGYLQGALALFQENLRMRLALRGDQHTDLTWSYNNLAGAQLRLGLFEEAEANYFRDQEIRERFYGADSVETSRTLNNLAALYQHWGGEHLAKARPLLERSLNIREQELRRHKSLGRDSVVASMQVLATQNNLATQSLLERRFEEAEVLFQRVLQGLDARSENRAVQRHRATVQRNLAVAQLGLGNHESAEANAREALATYRRNFVHWRIADAESVLGACLAGRDQIDQARYFLERSVDDLRHLLTERSRHVREAEERQVQWLGG